MSLAGKPARPGKHEQCARHLYVSKISGEAACVCGCQLSPHQVSQVEDKDVSKFGQMISDPNVGLAYLRCTAMLRENAMPGQDYTLDAPVVPMVGSSSCTFASHAHSA